MGLLNYLYYRKDSSENNFQNLIKFLAERSQVNNIFVIGDQSENFLPKNLVGIDYYKVREDASIINKLFNSRIISSSKFASLDKELIENSIIFCDEVDAKILAQFNSLAQFSKISPFILFRNPKVTVEELVKLKFAASIEGNFEKNTIILTGKYANPEIELKKKKILAIIAVFNEVDFIEKSITHFLENEVDVHILDNWSTDGSYEIVQKLAEKNKRLTFERFPEKAQTEFFFKNILTRKQQIAKEGKYDWYFHSDSDEIRTPPWKDKTLNEAISLVDELGFNAIDFTVIDFRPIKDGYTVE